MKKLLLLLLFFLLPSLCFGQEIAKLNMAVVGGGVPAAGGGISLVSSSQSYPSGSAAYHEISLSVTSGNYLVIAAQNYGSNASGCTITDQSSKLGTISKHIEKYKGDDTAEFSVVIASASITSSGTCTVRVTASGGATWHALSLSQWSGFNASPYDKNVSATNVTAPTTHDGGAITPASNNSVIIGAIAFIANAGTVTQDATFSGITTHPNNGDADGSYVGLSVEYIVQTTAASDNATWTTSTGCTDAMATVVFKP